MNNVDKIVELLNRSYSMFHVVKNMEEELLQSGYKRLNEKENYALEKGGKYFVTRNDSSIISFRIPASLDNKNLRFLITATHNDSPTFKLKPNPVKVFANLLMLETEPYGGGIYSTWLDRSLTIAGRVMVMSNKGLESKLLYIDEDLLEIPNVAIHMNRNINSGNSYNPAIDMTPILGQNVANFSWNQYLLDKLGLDNSYELISHDLYLVNRDKAHLMGMNQEFITSGRLDDLSSAYSSLLGYLDSVNSETISIFASFDNEEVGSLTKQGANSTFLQETLRRIVKVFGGEKDDYEKAVASSMMVSIDNAHANHPNHPEYSAKTTNVNLNEGIVIKYNANQSYTSDAYSSAILKALCKKNAIPYQEYANKSDIRGGSTLGNLSNSEVSLTSVDIGLPQLAMHSSYEIAGKKDLEWMIQLSKSYFESNLDLSKETIKI